MHTDIPTRADLEQPLAVRDPACVSIYVPTAPEDRGERDRLEFEHLSAQALEQLSAASLERDALNDVRDALDDLAADEAFWARQAHSLAVFATPSGTRTFQVANRLSPTVEVSDRFHVKPLLRSATFPQAAFVLALSQNAVRLIEVSPDAAPAEVRVPGMPSDAASAVGKSSTSCGSSMQSACRRGVPATTSRRSRARPRSVRSTPRSWTSTRRCPGSSASRTAR